jgi:hypothetical protein
MLSTRQCRIRQNVHKIKYWIGILLYCLPLYICCVSPWSPGCKRRRTWTDSCYRSSSIVSWQIVPITDGDGIEAMKKSILKCQLETAANPSLLFSLTIVRNCYSISYLTANSKYIFAGLSPKGTYTLNIIVTLQLLYFCTLQPGMQVSG